MNPFSKRGFVIPLAILAAFAVMFFVASLSTMNRGFRTSLNHLNMRQHMFNVAFSAYSGFLSKVHTRAWNDRLFKTAAYLQNAVTFGDAVFDLYAADTPGKEYQIDLYVRVKFQGSTQVFFWRLLYIDDILDTSGRVYPLVFLDVEARYFPGGGSSLDAMVNEILQKRKQNRPRAMDAAKTVASLNKVNDVANVLTAKSGGGALPEPDVGTRNPGAPSTPAPFEDMSDIQGAGGTSVPDAPSRPPQYEGPIGISNGGNATRVATRDGQGSVNAACIKESGTRIYVAVGGQTILSWKSKEKHSWPVIEEKRAERRKNMTDEEREKESKEWKKERKQGFNLSFPVKAGQKVTVSFVGRKKCTKYSNWCSVNGPF